MDIRTPHPRPLSRKGRGEIAATVLLVLVLAAGCRPKGTSEAPGQTAEASKRPPNPPVFAGSKSCRDCHEEFYKLWVTSHHGLAMQPYTEALAREKLSEQQADVVIGKSSYRAETGAAQGWVRELGPQGERKYPIAHAMGGKNIYYFLTPMERGRLQVLPVAYHVHKREWYDAAASGVRHFPDRRDEALPWTDRLFTFNTTCFNCHVSELSTNYDLATNTYRTTWVEPGISCESCHGRAREHVRVMEAAAPGKPPKDIQIIRTREFSPEQLNDMCATCHAKMIPLSISFLPGEKFFDHYDLVTLEHADYYADGRDLGENYTHTSWVMSPCARSGKLDCNHCHTPSGRLRFEGDQSNQLCMPCHQEKVENVLGHSQHPAGKGAQCVGCHMPMTHFAAMARSDHSMRPPTPATTIAFKSPNACNLCHADQSAAWADEYVRKWHPKDYQAEVVRRAELIDAARKDQWQRLPEMLADLGNPQTEVIYKTSLVRLLHGCPDPRKWPVILGLLQDRSPLVRSSAASALTGYLTPEVVAVLLAGTGDESRLVRIRAAMALAPVRPEMLPEESDRKRLAKAVSEFHRAMRARPDDWASYANLGNFSMERREFADAISHFETASALEPRAVGPLVNAAIAYSNIRRTDKAEQCLRHALQAEPANAAANFNLGLLLAEKGQLEAAEKALRAALKADPQMAPAAYNLGVIAAKSNLDEAILWCQKARDLRPDEPKYGHTLAYFLREKGNLDTATELLRQVIRQHPTYFDSYLLLGEIYEQRKDARAAADVYRQALSVDELPDQLRAQLQAKLRAIQPR